MNDFNPFLKTGYLRLGICPKEPPPHASAPEETKLPYTAFETYSIQIITRMKWSWETQLLR